MSAQLAADRALARMAVAARAVAARRDHPTRPQRVGPRSVPGPEDVDCAGLPSDEQ